MKKQLFLDSVCARLLELGLSSASVERQRVQIDKYLSSMGIGEESEALEGEDPRAFADGIFGILKEKHEKKAAEKNAEDQNETAEEDDVKVFISEAENVDKTKNIDEAEEMPPLSEEKEDAPEAEEDFIKHEIPAVNEEVKAEMPEPQNDEYSPGNVDDYYEDEEAEGATREYSISELISEEEQNAPAEEDDYYESEDGRSHGNPVFFYILAVLLSPVWIPVGALIFLFIGICYPLLILFVALYIPILILLILGGSALTLAELVYSIVKFVTGDVHIGLFELGLGFFALALTMCLSVLIYRGGTKYAPRAIKKYGKNVKKLIRRLRWMIKRFKGVCSI